MLKPLCLTATVLLACATSAKASFTYGYADNKCSVTLNSILKDAGSASASSDILRIKYTFTCPDAITYSIETWQKRNTSPPADNKWPSTGTIRSAKFNNCLPLRFDANPKYNEQTQQVQVVSAGVYYNCPDATIGGAAGGFASVYKENKAASQETWSSVATAKASSVKFNMYNSSDFTVSAPFANKIRPAKSFVQSGSVWQDQDAAIPVGRWCLKVQYTPDPKYFAIVHLLPGFTDGNFYNKPLVVGDAFDPFNQRGFVETAFSYRNYYDRAEYKNLAGPIGPRGKGYDIWFLDFAQGAGDIHVNAGLQLKFMEWLSAVATNKMIVAGPSMGGVIGRLALLYSQPWNNQAGVDYGARVKGFLAVDAPMQGASISPDLQNVVSTLAGMNLGGEDAAEGKQQVLRPATHQLLYEHAYDFATSGWKVSSEAHQDFYNHLKNLGGYRKDIPMAAIAYSNFYQHPAGINPVSNTNAFAFKKPVLGQTVTYNVWVRGKDWDAGSAGDWYWNSFKHTEANGSSVTKTFNGEKFKGTFIPIQSALDLDAVPYPVPANNYDLAKQSPFRFSYYMKDAYNGYCNTATPSVCQMIDANPRRQLADDKRYQHIIFDAALMKHVNNALDRLEASSTSLNTDGHDDLMYFGADGKTMARTSLVSGFGGWKDWSPAMLPPGDRYWIFRGDFDGDGDTDLGWQRPDHGFIVFPSDGTKFTTGKLWIQPGAWGYRTQRLYVGDFNGDGKDDLLSHDPVDHSHWVTLSTGSAFQGAGSGRWLNAMAFGANKDDYYPYDFNGDGKTDLGYLERADGSFHVQLSSGSAFGSYGQWVAPGHFGFGSPVPFAGDYTGDGRDDLMVFMPGPNKLWVLASTGSGFNTLGQWGWDGAFGSTLHVFHPADYNGDGRCDLGRYEPSDKTFHVWLTNDQGNGFLGWPSQWTEPLPFGNENARFMTTYKKKNILIP